jgi:hypothetical protein
MIVKNISALQYFLEKFEIIDSPVRYSVDYHPLSDKKEFVTSPTFVAEFVDCMVHSLPLLVTDSGNMITTPLWPLLSNVKMKPKKTGHGLWDRWGDTIKLNLPKFDKSFTGVANYVWLPIDKQSANNPWHIWIDVISKFRLMEKRYNKSYLEYEYILSNESEYFVKVVKTLFPDLKYYTMPEHSTWRFKHIYAPSMSNHEDGVTVPEMALWLRHKFSSKIEQPNRKIFISRKNALTRQLTNAEELFLSLKGWENISLEEMNIKQQIETFSSASHVIGTHGAGLVNLLWCKPGTKVIEINHQEQINKKPYPLLAHHLNLEHHLLLGEKVPLGNNKPVGVKRLDDYNNITVDVSEILNLLNKM